MYVWNTHSNRHTFVDFGQSIYLADQLYLKSKCLSLLSRRNVCFPKLRESPRWVLRLQSIALLILSLTCTINIFSNAALSIFRTLDCALVASLILDRTRWNVNYDEHLRTWINLIFVRGRVFRLFLLTLKISH